TRSPESSWLMRGRRGGLPPERVCRLGPFSARALVLRCYRQAQQPDLREATGHTTAEERVQSVADYSALALGRRVRPEGRDVRTLRRPGDRRRASGSGCGGLPSRARPRSRHPRKGGRCRRRVAAPLRWAPPAYRPPPLRAARPCHAEDLRALPIPPRRGRLPRKLCDAIRARAAIRDFRPRGPSQGNAVAGGDGRQNLRGPRSHCRRAGPISPILLGGRESRLSAVTSCTPPATAIPTDFADG